MFLNETERTDPLTYYRLGRWTHPKGLQSDPWTGFLAYSPSPPGSSNRGTLPYMEIAGLIYDALQQRVSCKVINLPAMCRQKSLVTTNNKLLLVGPSRPVNSTNIVGSASIMKSDEWIQLGRQNMSRCLIKLLLNVNPNAAQSAHFPTVTLVHRPSFKASSDDPHESYSQYFPDT